MIIALNWHCDSFKGVQVHSKFVLFNTDFSNFAILSGSTAQASL